MTAVRVPTTSALEVHPRSYDFIQLVCHEVDLFHAGALDQSEHFLNGTKPVIHIHRILSSNKDSWMSLQKCLVTVGVMSSSLSPTLVSLESLHHCKQPPYHLLMAVASFFITVEHLLHHQESMRWRRRGGGSGRFSFPPHCLDPEPLVSTILSKAHLPLDMR